MIRRKLTAFFLMVLLGTSQFELAKAAPDPAVPPAASPIKHLVVLMQENHTFDNYFGTYPGADGLPAGTKMPVDPKNPDGRVYNPLAYR